MLIAIIAPPIGIPLVFLSIIYIIGNHACLAVSIKPEEFDEPYDMETDIDGKVGPVVSHMVDDMFDDDLSFDMVMNDHYNSKS